MPSILLADSGSTKTDWCLLSKGKKPVHFKTDGLNPYICAEQDCIAILEQQLPLNPEKEGIDKVVFYGAGIKDQQQSSLMKKILDAHFKDAETEVHSDLLAAARASCRTEKGLCCILGTGSNSGYYDGLKIRYSNPSLGYIIGDEGSGTYLGKRVLQYYFYNTFDEDLTDAFKNKYGNNLPEILHKVYKEPFGNRYLASFTRFLLEHRGHYMVENIIEDALIDFHQRHILKYRESWQYPIHFVGGIAYEFKDVLFSLQEQYGLETGQILKTPMEGLIKFHQGRGIE
jgi:N-acetylglucosamine kinase-like BadF-type ATPase